MVVRFSLSLCVCVGVCVFVGTSVGHTPATESCAAVCATTVVQCAFQRVCVCGEYPAIGTRFATPCCGAARCAIAPPERCYCLVGQRTRTQERINFWLAIVALRILYELVVSIACLLFGFSQLACNGQSTISERSARSELL